MKILHVIPFFSPKFGGSVTVAYELAKEFARRNHDVTVITTDFGYDPQYAKTIQDSGVKVVPFHCIANIASFLYSPSIKPWLESNLKEYDIIHLHNYRSYQNAMVQKYSMRYEIPIIMQPHGSILPFFENQNLKKLYDYIWKRKNLMIMAKFIALTENEANQFKYMGVPDNKITIIPNAIDLTQFESLPLEDIFKLKYGISKEDKILLFLGRIHRIKGIDLLIDAFYNLKKEIPNFKLVIVGPDSGYLSELKKQINKLKIQNDIVFTGPLYHTEKIEAYCDADVYILPSIFESFPNTILEAWACGTPVILMDSCDISSIAKQASIVVKRNPIDLAAAIKKIIHDDAFREMICANGKSLVNHEFNKETVSTNIEECYRQNILNSVTKKNSKNLKRSESVFPYSVSFNIHNLITFSIEGNNKKIIDHFKRDYAYFISTSEIDPDFRIIVSDFELDIKDCNFINYKYYVRDNYIACSDRYKIVKWKLSIKDIETKPIVNFNGGIFSELFLRDYIIEPLIAFLLVQKGYILMHASSIAYNNQGIIFPATKGTGKTATLLNFMKDGGVFLSNEPSMIGEN